MAYFRFHPNFKNFDMCSNGYRFAVFPIAFPIDPNCFFVILLIGSPLSFRICPKYFACCVLGCIFHLF